MTTLLRTIVLGSFALLPTQPLESREALREFATSFCPECWKFLKAKDSMCGDTCATCGKEAVAVDASILTWSWCSEHDWWHRKPCASYGTRRDLKVRTGTAIIVSPGDERLQKTAYCPECRIHPDAMKTERGRCPLCRGPLVVVDTIEATWFWCGHGLHWKADPCPDNGTRHCCIARRGTLLAKIRSLGRQSEAGR